LLPVASWRNVCQAVGTSAEQIAQSGDAPFLQAVNAFLPDIGKRGMGVTF